MAAGTFDKPLLPKVLHWARSKVWPWLRELLLEEEGGQSVLEASRVRADDSTLAVDHASVSGPRDMMRVMSGGVEGCGT